MIKAKDAIAAARALIGTPYSELDCINLIKKVIRTAPGGVPGYTTAGTNTLWASYEASAKYRDLIWRQESLSGAQAGMLAFKRYGTDDEGHVGLVTGDGTVIHSSSAKGRVVETTLSTAEGWDLLAKHRYIETAADAAESEGNDMSVLYEARVVTEKDPLRVRDSPATGRILGHVPKGRTVEVLEALENGWARIRCNELEGYASVLYLERIQAADEEAEEIEAEEIGGVTIRTILTDSAGNTWEPDGDFTVKTIIEVDGESMD